MKLLDKEIFTADEVAKLLQISKVTLWKLRKYRGLPSFKVGREVRFFKHELLRWIQDERYREAQLGLGFEQQLKRQANAKKQGKQAAVVS